MSTGTIDLGKWILKLESGQTRMIEYWSKGKHCSESETWDGEKEDVVEEVWKKKKTASVCMYKHKAGGEPLLGSHVQGYMNVLTVNVLTVVDCSFASANA